MAQRLYITPFRCLATHSHRTQRDASSLLQRSAQCRNHSTHLTAPARWRNTLYRNPLLNNQPHHHRKKPWPQPNKPHPPHRPFTTTPTHSHGDLTPPKPGSERHVTFIDKEGAAHTFEVADGDNLLDIAQANDLEMEGACGGSCACSTCHVIVREEEMFDKMEEPSDDENDMLDLAFGLTETSRLGCQVVMSEGLDGLVVKLPSMTRNMQASDFEKK